MDYLDKLFKQYPFVYRINEQYYVFGVGVCIRCSSKNNGLISEYNSYVRATQQDNIQDIDAWNIFHAVLLSARLEIGKQDLNEHLNVTNMKKKIEKYGFTDDDLGELESQIKCYVDFVNKHDLSHWLRNVKN